MRADDRDGVRWFSSPYTAIALLCLGGFAHQTLSVTVITMASDLFKHNEVATVAGMAGTCGNAGVLVFSLIIGGLVAQIGYTPFFICLGVLDLVGAVVLWTVVREPPAGQLVSQPLTSGYPIDALNHPQSDLSRLQPGSVDRARRRRLLHRDLDL